MSYSTTTSLILELHILWPILTFASLTWGTQIVCDARRGEGPVVPKSLRAVMGRYDVEQSSSVILLMEEILHHMGCIKPCKYWDIYHINRCRISSINSRKRFDLTWFKVEGSMVKHLLGHQLRTNWQRWNSQGVRTSAYWFRNSECNLAAEVHVFGSRTLKVVILLSGPCGKCRPRPSDHPLFKITNILCLVSFSLSIHLFAYLFQSFQILILKCFLSSTKILGIWFLKVTPSLQVLCLRRLAAGPVAQRWSNLGTNLF